MPLIKITNKYYISTAFAGYLTINFIKLFANFEARENENGKIHTQKVCDKKISL